MNKKLELFIYSKVYTERITMIRLTMILLLIIVLFFSVPIGFILENDDVYGITYSCDVNTVICIGDLTDDEIAGTDNNDLIFGWIGNDYLRGMALILI